MCIRKPSRKLADQSGSVRSGPVPFGSGRFYSVRSGLGFVFSQRSTFYCTVLASLPYVMIISMKHQTCHKDPGKNLTEYPEKVPCQKNPASGPAMNSISTAIMHSADIHQTTFEIATIFIVMTTILRAE